jgi:hypothetical protein
LSLHIGGLGDGYNLGMEKPPLPPRLQMALDACHAVGPSLTGEICFRWIGEAFRAKGVTYRDLAMLARRGYLRRTGQGRYTVYYRLVD